MYDIQITYETGSSFESHEESDYVGAVTDTIEDAKENLRRIKEHNEQEARDWEDDYKPLVLLTTNGERTWEHPFWVGYFEHLIEAKVVATDLSYRP